MWKSCFELNTFNPPISAIEIDNVEILTKKKMLSTIITNHQLEHSFNGTSSTKKTLSHDPSTQLDMKLIKSVSEFLFLSFFFVAKFNIFFVFLSPGIFYVKLLIVKLHLKNSLRVKSIIGYSWLDMLVDLKQVNVKAIFLS
jgi:hypothetical protein